MDFADAIVDKDFAEIGIGTNFNSNYNSNAVGNDDSEGNDPGVVVKKSADGFLLLGETINSMDIIDSSNEVGFTTTLSDRISRPHDYAKKSRCGRFPTGKCR